MTYFLIGIIVILFMLWISERSISSFHKLNNERKSLELIEKQQIIDELRDVIFKHIENETNK